MLGGLYNISGYAYVRYGTGFGKAIVFLAASIVMYPLPTSPTRIATSKNPVDFDQFIKVVKSIENFWFTVVKLPPHRNA